jgi:hypothetical protein
VNPITKREGLKISLSKVILVKVSQKRRDRMTFIIHHYACYHPSLGAVEINRKAFNMVAREVAI